VPTEAELEAAVAFFRGVAACRGRRAAIAYCVAHARAAVRAVATFHRLPAVDVRVSGTAAGAHIRALTERRTLGIRRPRYAMAVMPVEPPSDYLRGRARQAVRTNCAGAARAGVVCRRIDDVDEQAVVTRAVLTRRDELDNWPRLRDLIASGRDAMFVAEADGTPLVIAFVTIDAASANLGWCLSVPDDPRASAARYLVHVHLFGVLAALDVPFLFADAVVVVPQGLRYFHDRLGFVVRNLRYRPDPPRRDARPVTLPLRDPHS
jgi:hypothetical protein